jgi:hypothetical protein
MTRENDLISHFSEHDFKGTQPRIAHVDATGHEQQEENLGTEQHTVVEERDVSVQPHARLRFGHPDRVQLSNKSENASLKRDDVGRGRRFTSAIPEIPETQVSTFRFARTVGV